MNDINSIITRMRGDLDLLTLLAADGIPARAAASQREATHPAPPAPPALVRGPTTVAQIDADRDALRSRFFDHGHFIGQDELHCVAVHHTADQLIALGFIEPGKLGRWLYGYIPAGELLQQLNTIRT